ncbi:MAG: beta-lactamase family protein [Bacteroidales bacterium]|jgi:CubicO group peptidase (beta-lactamase class C family)|nr:beta-lactamase family protein [Bacteroidales bacterium]
MKAKLIVLTAVIQLLVFLSCSREAEQYDFHWPVSSPATEGLDKKMIDSAFIRAGQLGFVDGLLIIRNGKLIAEKYYNGYSRHSPHQIYSDTKSFMSALVGIALDQGLIESLEKKIMDFFPEYAYTGMDQRFYDITVRHLLTMRMGIDKEENNLLAIVATDNWIRETFKLPLLFDPGTKFSYNSLETHLLSAIITRTSGMSALEFAVKNLTGPAGIEIIAWSTDPQGNSTGGYDIYMKPYDMAVLGYLYLNGGKIENIQIVPEEWVNASLAPTWPSNGREWGALTDYNYGYLWWLGKINGHSLFMAMGMGGQYIMVFPGQNLIVVTTANKNIGWDNNQELPIIEVVSQYILEAVK